MSCKEETTCSSNPSLSHPSISPSTRKNHHRLSLPKLPSDQSPPPSFHILQTSSSPPMYSKPTALFPHPHHPISTTTASLQNLTILYLLLHQYPNPNRRQSFYRGKNQADAAPPASHFESYHTIRPNPKSCREFSQMQILHRYPLSPL